MSEETKSAFEAMRFYKFYPMQSPDAPDVSNVKVSAQAFEHGFLEFQFLKYVNILAQH